jgi:hypothetical protein
MKAAIGRSATSVGTWGPYQASVVSRDFIGTMYRTELTARIKSNFRYIRHDCTEYEAGRAASRRTIASAFAFA